MNDPSAITPAVLSRLAEAAGRERGMSGRSWPRHRHGSVLEFLTDQLTAMLREQGDFLDPVGTAHERIDAAYDRGVAAQRKLEEQAELDAFAARALAAS